MCDGPDPSDSSDSILDYQKKEAARARQEERERQKSINQGNRRIDAIFDGGRYVSEVNEVSRTPLEITKVPGTNTAPGGATGRGDDRLTVQEMMGMGYSRQDALQEWNYPGSTGIAQDLAEGAAQGSPTTFKVGDKTFASRSAAKRYANKNADVEYEKVWDRSAGMDPLLDQREKAIRSFYSPQIRESAQSAREQLMYSLARAGLSSSSVRRERMADLDADVALQKGQLDNRVAADRAEAKSGLEAERASLKANLLSTADASEAVNAALTRMSNFAESVPTLDPLGDVFAGTAEGIGQTYNGYRSGQLVGQVDDARSTYNIGSSGRSVG